MQEQGFHDLAADGLDRIEGAEGLLKNHADPSAADPVQFGLAGLDEVLALKQDFPAEDFSVGLRQQPHDGKRRDALAAAGFADDAQGLPARHAEAHAVHGARDGPAGFKSNGQVADLEQRRLAHGCL